jgi:hypothetical protein
MRFFLIFPKQNEKKMQITRKKAPDTKKKLPFSGSEPV